MIYILSWTTQKYKKNPFQVTTFKEEENSRTFRGKMEFKEFSRTSPKIQGLFKTARTAVIEADNLGILTTIECNSLLPVDMCTSLLFRIHNTN